MDNKDGIVVRKCDTKVFKIGQGATDGIIVGFTDDKQKAIFGRGNGKLFYVHIDFLNHNKNKKE